MPINIEKEIVMPNFGFDVAFKSDVAPMVTATSNNPIAMAFGYSYSTDVKAEVGEVTKQPITLNSNVSFQLYDLAATPQLISTVVISFINLDTKGQAAPFDGWPNGQMTFSGAQQIVACQGAPSMGCNVTSTVGYGLGGVPSTNFEAKYAGTYEMTITVTLQNGNVFRVDPEMDVSGE